MSEILIITMIGWVIARLEVIAAAARIGERHAESELHPPFLKAKEQK